MSHLDVRYSIVRAAAPGGETVQRTRPLVNGSECVTLALEDRTPFFYSSEGRADA